MRKVISSLLIVLVLVASLAITASAATQTTYDYDSFRLSSSENEAYSAPHSGTGGMVDCHVYTGSKYACSFALEMDSGSGYKRVLTGSCEVNSDATTGYYIPTGTATFRGVIWIPGIPWSGSTADGVLTYGY